FKKIAHRRRYAAGEHIFSGEEQTDFFASVCSGVVKLTKVLFDGRQQVVGLLLAPDTVGRICRKRSPYFAEAATDVELCCFPHGSFEQMLDGVPELKQRLLEQTLDELDSARDWMVLLGRKTAEERVASLFLMLATRANCSDYSEQIQRDSLGLDLHLKRQEIGDFLGLSYETVCRQITALKKKGLIEQPGRRRFRIPDTEALTRTAG
ncbi:MAG TPA: Crp/Fnr family transcriptional regulator, partial [Rhizobiales bacterium]|nr:Crp/Fnr family transcriptional regulator [Hyphomicrobiales bacterium]